MTVHWFRLHCFCSRCETPLWSSPKMQCCNFQPSSKYCGQCSTDAFLVFYSMSTHNAPLPELLSANPNPSPICCWYISTFNLDFSCYPSLDLGTPLHVQLTIRFSPIAFLSLCFFACLDSLFYIWSFLFHLLVADPLISLENNLKPTGVPNYFTPTIC